MPTLTQVVVIKGSPREKWNEVHAIQHQPFVYIQSNGSRWAGEEAADVDELLEVLRVHKLDSKMFRGKFITTNPCQWAYGDPSKGEPQYVDGERLYECEGVHSFFGNFIGYSHVFNIDTNDPATIAALSMAIEGNGKLPEPQ